MLIVIWKANEVFTGSGKKFPFSLGLSDLCRSFKLESNTGMKIDMSHVVLLINEVHNVVEKSSLLFIMTTF